MNKTALPTKLSFHAPNLREQIEALPEGTALIGISTHGDAIAVDLTAECPHVLVCTSTGGGSTTVLRSLTAQFLHQGAHALVIDPKRISHLWARGLPTVTHRGNGRRHPRRPGRPRRGTGAPPRPQQQRAGRRTPAHRLGGQRLQRALGQLTRYWETFRGNDDPHTSPAVAALEAALWTGRAARVHVILDGTPAPGVLGAAPHEMFGTVILARVSAGTWQRLAPLAGPAPKPSKHPGRLHVIQQGTTIQEKQAIVMTDADVVNWLTDSDDKES
ncbi:hypothetical protein [Streptomyces sp. NPDC020141]|uniref:hypothetical protein n=1 Tax=Streptomyces sp. NPDC020141 TaxID=3365065 RepID=UPI0037A7AFE6